MVCPNAQCSFVLETLFYKREKGVLNAAVAITKLLALARRQKAEETLGAPPGTKNTSNLLRGQLLRSCCSIARQYLETDTSV